MRFFTWHPYHRPHSRARDSRAPDCCTVSRVPPGHQGSASFHVSNAENQELTVKQMKPTSSSVIQWPLDQAATRA